jgi:YD repeat-containing protein
VKGWIANKKYQYNTIPTCPGGFVPPDIIDGFDVARYEIWGNWVYLQSSTETNWDEEGLNPVVKSTDYYHDDLAHLLVTKIETTDGENRTLRTELKYPTDYPGNAACSSMVTKNILAPVINFKQTKPASSTSVTEVETTYSNAGSDNFVPAEIKKSTHGGSLVSEGTFNSYDSKGNLLQYTDKSGVISSIVWGYNYLYPVAKITGASYASVIATLTGGSVTALQTMDGSTLLAELNNIRTGLPNALVTTSTYKHLAGVSAMVDANNRKSSYEYDAFNRLVMVRDQDGYVVKKICYNYNGQTEDCTSECTNTTPNWQNTETAQRCELSGSCAYTGYKEQEQVDQNTCSPTHLQTRWVRAAYNPTGCASSGMLSMSVVNNAAVSGYVITYTKTTSPYTAYTFTVPAGGGVVGCIPSGTYNVNIHKTSGFPPVLSFSINGSYVISTSATFYNIVMNTFNTANRTTTIDIAD